MTVQTKRNIYGEGIWVGAGQILSALGTLVGLRLLTSLLSPNVFGEVVLLTGIVLLANGLAASPLMQGVLRFYPETVKANQVSALRAVATRFLTRSTLLMIAFCLIGFAICSSWVPVSLWLGPLIVLLLIIEVGRQLELTMLNAARCQRETALWIVLDAWSRPAVAWLMITLMGATAVATIAGYVVASGLLLVWLKSWRRVDHGFNKVEPSSTPGDSRLSLSAAGLSTSLMRYSLPLLPLGLIGWLTGQADRYLIGGMVGVKDAGLYAALYGIVSRPFLMAGGILETWIRPIYYEAVAAQEAEQEKKVLYRWIGAVISAAVIGTGVFMLLHREIAMLFLAESYRANASLMPWIASGYGLLMVAQVYGRVCYAHHDTKAVLLSETVGCAVALFTTVYAVSRFGLAGAAYAVPVYFSAQLAFAIFLAHRAEGRRTVTELASGHSNA